MADDFHTGASGDEMKTSLVKAKAVTKPGFQSNAQEYTVAMIKHRYICAKVNKVTDNGVDPFEVWAIVQGQDLDVKALPGPGGGGTGVAIKGVWSSADNAYVWNDTPTVANSPGQKLKVEGLQASTYGWYRFIVWFLNSYNSNPNKAYYIETIRTRIEHDPNVNMTDCG